MARMLGRLGWRGQCACCNGPRAKRQIRAEEQRTWWRDTIETLTTPRDEGEPGRDDHSVYRFGAGRSASS